MKDACVIDAAHPFAASLRLASVEPHDAVQGTGWLHDGRPPNGSECLFFFVMLWHVCSLFQPTTSQHVTVFPSPSTRHHWHPSGLSESSLSSLERLVSAWPSHPMHVSVLTSPGDPPRVRPYDTNNTIDSDAARAYPDVQPTGGGGGGGGDGNSESARKNESESMGIAWRGSGVLDDDGGVRGLARAWSVEETWYTWTCDAYGSTRVTAWMDGMVEADTAFPEESLMIGVALRISDDGLPVDDTWHPRTDDRPGAWKRTTSRTVLQDPVAYEARGVGVIVKALVQQNAGASLFLRTMVCVAAVLCWAYSILVLGERPRFIGCCTGRDERSRLGIRG